MNMVSIRVNPELKKKFFSKLAADGVTAQFFLTSKIKEHITGNIEQNHETSGEYFDGVDTNSEINERRKK